jgi:hypothetical protein
MRLVCEVNLLAKETVEMVKAGNVEPWRLSGLQGVGSKTPRDSLRVFSHYFNFIG